MIVTDSMYPKCGMCNGEGTLLPVKLSQDGDSVIVYRCTNPDCNVKFDKHGYSRYDTETQTWVLTGEG